MVVIFLSFKIFCFVALFLKQAEAVGCPNGWVVHDGNCYLFVDQLEDWATASAFCEGMGAHLVTVESARENHFLQTTLQHLHGTTNQNVFYWMGGNDIASESEWVWSRTETPVNYSNWCPGQPDDNNGQDCLEFHGFCQFKWDDARCDKKGRIICEIDDTDTDQINIIG